MAILNNSNAISSGGYDINNSLRFRSSNSAYLSRTFSASGTTATFSVWVKRSIGNYQTIFGWSNLSNTSFGIDLNLDTLAFYSYSSAFVLNLVTTQVLRDPSAWYHIVCVIDTTQATAANRAKIYINGSQVTALSTATYPSQNTSLNLATNTSWSIGRVASATTHYDGYMAEWNFIDGQALTPSSFGETSTTTGSWIPKAYTGTYGTNGFYLKFSDIATTSGSNAGLGKDFSGNANYWTTNNISVTAGTTYDAMIDSPTLTSATVANYCVMNSASPYGSSLTLSQANLKITCAGAYWAALPATFGVSSGKWYWEVHITNLANNSMLGITKETDTGATTGQNVYPGISANSYGYIAGGQKYNNATGTSYGASYTTNDIIGIALNMDAGTLTYYKNNTPQGTAFSGLSGIYLPSIGVNDTNTAVSVNFGQRPFTYTPPTGFVALNTFNLPDSTIVKGNTVMDAVTRNGGGTSGGTYSTTIDLSQGGLLWDKTRSSAQSHYLTDSVRGISKLLNSNTTNSEATDANWFTSFNNGSYTTGSTDWGTGITIVDWIWKAGGAGVSNTSGSITSTVSVNATAGFSVVTFNAGTAGNKTVGHGLGVAPALWIVKSTGSANSWSVGSQALAVPAARFLALDLTSSVYTDTRIWANTAPSSTVLSFESGYTLNAGINAVAYCWAEIAGFSKFGSYTGNGSADGPFVFTNLKPRFIMIKRTDTTSNWTILDTAREGYNVDNDPLYPNLSDAEGTTDLADILSNGFKLRSTDASVNANAGTYIYACFSSNPFKNSTAV